MTVFLIALNLNAHFPPAHPDGSVDPRARTAPGSSLRTTTTVDVDALDVDSYGDADGHNSSCRRLQVTRSRFPDLDENGNACVWWRVLHMALGSLQTRRRVGLNVLFG